MIIPTLDAAAHLPELVGRLRNQTVRECEIVVVDSDSRDGTVQCAERLGCSTLRVGRKEFDHGGTRNLGAGLSRGRTFVFLTQDALPVSEEFLERLTAPIDGVRTAGAYARQIPRKDASPSERFVRAYNYPEVSSRRSLERIARRSLRSLMFSNVASAVDRACFEKVGGFPAPAVTNEDMLLCAKLFDAGFEIVYESRAEVIHSHDSSIAALFTRYFRMGIWTRRYREVLRCVDEPGDGLRFVREQIAYVRRTGFPGAIPRCVVEAMARAAGYECGKISESVHGILR